MTIAHDGSRRPVAWDKGGTPTLLGSDAATDGSAVALRGNGDAVGWYVAAGKLTGFIGTSLHPGVVLTGSRRRRRGKETRAPRREPEE